MGCSVPPNQLHTKAHLSSKAAFANHTVVNLSKRTLTAEETNVLSLGMNFALVPQSSPVEAIIQQTEPTLRRLDKPMADEIRLEIHQALKKHKPAKPNISRQDLSAIKALRQDKSIHILRADKGNATVVMDTSSYNNKVRDILDSSCYRELRKDPTPALERRLQQKLLSLQRSGNIPQPLYRQLRPSNSKCPRFFGQPKIHKTDVPLRPIVATRGGPTYDTARHLAKILKPLVGNTIHHVKNSEQFANLLKDITLRPDDIMVSFDVVSLFTNVPTPDASTIARDRLQADPSLKDRTDLTPDQLHDLLLTCIGTSNFRWRDRFYEQSAGTSMGSPLSPVLADLFMEEFEQLAINTADHSPIMWLLYVGDTFVIWQHGQEKLCLFLEHLNGLHSNIQFTMEQERNGSISFLDVEVSRQEDGTLSRSVYRKPTHTDRYLHSTSFHHPKIKSSVNRTLIRRAYNICDSEHLPQELHHITTAMQHNGYNPTRIPTQDPRPPPGQRVTYTQSQPNRAPSSITLPYFGTTSHHIQRILHKHGIRVFHTTPLKIQHLLTSHKDRQDPHRRPGVYKIPCQCGKVYIGETGRDLPTRLNEHRAHGRKGDIDKSSIVKHSYTEDHTIHWDQAKLITSIEHWYPRRIREAIEIYRHNTVPQDIGVNISDIWRPILKPSPVSDGSPIP